MRGEGGGGGGAWEEDTENQFELGLPRPISTGSMTRMLPRGANPQPRRRRSNDYFPGRTADGEEEEEAAGMGRDKNGPAAQGGGAAAAEAAAGRGGRTAAAEEATRSSSPPGSSNSDDGISDGISENRTRARARRRRSTSRSPSPRARLVDRSIRRLSQFLRRDDDAAAAVHQTSPTSA